MNTPVIGRIFLLWLLLAAVFDAKAQNTLVELYGRKTVPLQFEFKNASVQYTEKGKSYQKIIARYTADTTDQVSFHINGKQTVSADIKKGNNLFLIPYPSVTAPTKIKISTKTNSGTTREYSMVVTPVKKWHIYFVQHTHTDIGYTHPQSEVLASQMRYIDLALDYCDQTDNFPDESKFRWSCESAWVTKEYLRSRPQSQIERLKKRVKEGRIEVTALNFNMAEISDENIMYDFLQPLKDFQKAGIPVKTAMQDDVNGIAWCLPDYLKNTGVRYLNMGVNETRSILPFDKPTPFWWESPAGERLLAFRAEHYMTGNFFKRDRTSPDFEEKMLWYLADIERKQYPFDRMAIQLSGYFTDNSPPSLSWCDVVKEWNAKYEYPKLKLSVVSEFLEYVEKNYGDKLPVYRNAWLDWWTDGFASTSRETAEIRKLQNLKQAGEGMFAMIRAMGGQLSPATEDAMQHVSENALFFAEHTVGADESIQNPDSENSTRQWLQKGAYAWEALKSLTLLNEEAGARLESYLPKAESPLLYVINSMGWQRSGSVEIFTGYEIMPVDKEIRVIDVATGKAVPAQVLKKRPEGAYWLLEVNDVPAMGVKAYKIDTATNEAAFQPGAKKEILENQYYKIEVDKNTGSVKSFFDKELNHELADNSGKWKIGQLIHETIPRRDSMSPRHSTVSNIKVDTVSETALWESIRIDADMLGFYEGDKNDPKGISAEVRLYRNSKKVEFRFFGRKKIVTSPEGLYVAFPFSLPGARIVFETIGGTLAQGQQLPGSSSDWNVAQNFVSIRGKTGQIIVISDEIPLWQFSDLNLGKFERYPKPGKTSIYSWVMNNYWFTNFRAAQEGAFSWSYQVTSTADTSNTFATRYAWGIRNPFFTRTVQAGTGKIEKPIIETLKIDGSPNAFLVNSRPSFTREGRILLHFRELEGVPAEIKIASGVRSQTIKKIIEVNVTGKEIGSPLSSIKLKPFEVKFIELELTSL